MSDNEIKNDEIPVMDDDFLAESFDENLDDNFDDDFDSEFEDDFLDDEGLDDFAETSVAASNEKTNLNWMNIGIIGLVGVVVIGFGYMLFFSGDGSNKQISQAPEPFKPSIQPAQPPQEQSLEQKINESGGILSNPDLLASETFAIDDAGDQNENNLQSEEEIMGMLDNPPSISEQEMDDIFSAIQSPDDQSSTPSAPPVSQDIFGQDDLSIIELPLPSDMPIESVDVDENSVQLSADMDGTIADEIINNQEPDIGGLPVVRDAQPDFDNNVTQEQQPEPVMQEVDKINTGEEGDRVDDLNARLDDLSSQITRIMDIMEAQSQSQQASQPSANEGDENFVRIEKALSRLENRINDVANQQKQPSKAPVAKTTPQRTVQKAPQPTSPKPKIKWELRGASQGEAIIAVENTQNLRTIKTGEVVDGLGRITSIAVEDGRWVVRGTSATIRQ